MTLNKIRILLSLSAFFLLTAATVFAQQGAKPKPPAASGQKDAATPQQKGPAAAAPKDAKPNVPKTDKKPDQAAAYYHFGLAHMYEEMMAMYGRSEYATKAIEEYRQAIENDPSSEYLNAALAELYAKTGRIRDAILEAQEIVKRDPDNLEAHKLLGRIYLRSLGDLQPGTQSREVLGLAIEQYEAMTRIEPKSADNHLLLGRLYFLNKDLTKAETEFKTAISLDANSEEAITNLAYLYNEEGDNKKANDLLNSVPEGRRSAKLYIAMGGTYEQQKDYKKAIAAFRQALAMDKENLDAMRGLAQNLSNDNQIDAALDEYRTIQDADPQDATAALRVAEIYRRQGKFDLAMENLKKAGALVQDSLEIPYNEALVLEAQGKYEEAATVLQKMVARPLPADARAGDKGNRALFLERLGNIYREAGRPLLAMETFRKIVDLGGDEAARGYQDVIDAYRDQKQWSDATRTAHEAVKKLPNDKGLKLTLAQQLADTGKPEESVQIAKAVLKGGPEDRDTYIMLSQIYMRLKRWKESEDAIAQAEKYAVRPEEKEYIRFLQGSIFERQKKIEQAEQAFRQVLQQNPSNSMALNYLGYMLADHNSHLEEALTLVKKALDFDPQNGAYLDSLGWVYFKLGNYDQAEENLRRAADKSPNDATVQDHLGELYARTSRFKLAAAHWEHALDEWSKSAPADVDQQDVARVTKKLENTKVKLAQQTQK
ncbi:MAG TPA: tetratricopeptide repeat protein [Candidatus Angelobacter sp.]|nr:tetratricopeptide repeat protein [Candidatus Angelobacter sp.]